MVDHRKGNGTTAERKHLARLRADLAWGAPPALLRPGMERLGLAELEALAREQSEMPRTMELPSERGTVIQAALEELYRREGASALERVSRWPDTPGRGMAVSALMLLHIAADWESAMRHLERSPEPVDGSWLSAALRQAAARNADDFLRVIDLQPAGDRRMPLALGEPLEFAAGFDFAKVHAAGDGHEGRAYLAEWARRHPDAAWDGVTDTFSSGGLTGWQDIAEELSELTEGVRRGKGDLEGMEWLGGKVAALPPETRNVLFDAGIATASVSGEAYARFFSRLEPSDIRHVIGRRIEGNMAVFFPAMDLLPREELILCLTSRSREQFIYADGVSGVPERLRKRFSLTPEEIQRIENGSRPVGPWREQ